ncbi:hypothetical protein NDU88_003312 [Pleurodeles waltl]|uniref:Uncharacterized protein n=1 Tax=Pleurodeles waltl TaxID=8319 RepID=A0AAV7MS31_PLEWA|nr:hypothetical protein NDU88_003312 [Pleurodeles waltl]
MRPGLAAWCLASPGRLPSCCRRLGVERKGWDRRVGDLDALGPGECSGAVGAPSACGTAELGPASGCTERLAQHRS